MYEAYVPITTYAVTLYKWEPAVVFNSHSDEAVKKNLTLLFEFDNPRRK